MFRFVFIVVDESCRVLVMTMTLIQISSISGSDLSDGDDTLENMQGISGPMVSFISQGEIH